MIRVPEWYDPKYNEGDALEPCSVCGNGLAPYDEFRCRHCDPVERINALAERYLGDAWSNLTAIRLARIYIECVDIILESE